MPRSPHRSRSGRPGHPAAPLPLLTGHVTRIPVADHSDGTPIGFDSHVGEAWSLREAEGAASVGRRHAAAYIRRTDGHESTVTITLSSAGMSEAFTGGEGTDEAVGFETDHLDEVEALGIALIAAVRQARRAGVVPVGESDVQADDATLAVASNRERAS